MRHVKSDYPPGTVIVPTSGAPRFHEFQDSLEELRVPAGTRRSRTESSDITRALNSATEQMIGDWAFFIGDDHAFDPNILLRLLSHNLPAVVCLNISRHPPFGPMFLRGDIDKMPVQIGWEDVPGGDGLWYLPKDLHTGNNGLLVKKEILDRIEKPIWRCGQIQPGIVNEDFYFWKSLRAMNIPVVVDLGSPMWHTNSFSVLPLLRDGRWTVGFARHGKVFLEKR